MKEDSVSIRYSFLPTHMGTASLGITAPFIMTRITATSRMVRVLSGNLTGNKSSCFEESMGVVRALGEAAGFPRPKLGPRIHPDVATARVQEISSV